MVVGVSKVVIGVSRVVIGVILAGSRILDNLSRFLEPFYKELIYFPMGKLINFINLNIFIL